MRVFLVGPAARYREQLAGGLSAQARETVEIVALPPEAAFCADFDAGLGTADAVVSLRFRRASGQAPPFRLLQVPGAGLDGIDLAALSDRTTVCNVFEHEVPIAEFVLCSMLQWELRLEEARQAFSPETWAQLYRDRPPHGELCGRTLGLLGFGRIGQAVARRAAAFGVRILALSPSVPEAPPPVERVMPPSALPELLRAADYLVVACPLSEATRGLLDAERLRMLRPSAVLINVSRAQIVEQAALYAALSEGRLRGASLDVWYRYPAAGQEAVAPADYPFHRLGNAVCTPHISAWTTALMERRYGAIARNLNALVAQQPLENVVRPARKAPKPGSGEEQP